MKKFPGLFYKEVIVIFIITAVITSLFFYKTVLLHQIPFPGDLLASENPYKTQSFLGYAPGGYPNIAQGMDVITELLPWKKFSITEMKHGQLPFWNPHNFSGNVLMQNFQSAIFYPFNLFFFIFSFPTAWTMFIFFQPVLAMLFMYLFLRSIGMNQVTSFIGSIAFAFSSYMTVWIEYGNIDNTLVWLPLVLFALNKFLEKPKTGYFLLSVASLTISFLAGYVQGVFYIYLLSIAFILYKMFFVMKQNSVKSQENEKKIQNSRFTIRGIVTSQYISLILVFLLPVCLTSFQIFPTLSAFQQSTRSNYSLTQIENLLQPLYYWITILVPDFFGNPAHRNFFLPITYIERVMYFGVPFVMFGLIALFKVKNRDMVFFFSVGIIVLLLTTNLPLIKYFYLLPIPMISTTVPTRALSIFIFCMLVVGCYGINYWLMQKKLERTFIPCTLIGVYVTLLIGVLVLSRFIPILQENRSVVLHNLVIPGIIVVTSVIIFYTRQIKFFEKFAWIALVCVVTGDLFLNFQKITPFAPKELLYPQTPIVSYLQQHAGINRFWGYGSGYILSNFQTFDGTYSPEGNDPLHNKDYGLLLASSKDGKYPTLVPRPDANIAPGYGLTDMQNPSRQQILNLLGVKYIVYQDDTLSSQQPKYDVFPQKTYGLVWQKGSWQVYENKSVLPRFFLTSDYIVEPDTRQALHDIYQTDVKRTVILDQIPKTTIPSHPLGSVSLISYAPNTITFKTQTKGTMLLFLSDTYNPSWHATVDTVATSLYKADVAFRAVVVPAGEHTITMSYVPQYFNLGLTIAIVSLFLYVGYAVYLYNYEKQ